MDIFKFSCSHQPPGLRQNSRWKDAICSHRSRRSLFFIQLRFDTRTISVWPASYIFCLFLPLFLINEKWLTISSLTARSGKFSINRDGKRDGKDETERGVMEGMLPFWPAHLFLCLISTRKTWKAKNIISEVLFSLFFSPLHFLPHVTVSSLIL